MTAIAILFERNRMMIAADTLGYAPDRKSVRPLGFISKVMIIPHLRGVLFSRGMFQVTVESAASLLLSPQLATIEAAADALPEILIGHTEKYAARQGISDWPRLGLLELVFAGWSETENRMKLWQYISSDLFRPREDEEGHYGSLSFPRLPPKYAVVAADLSESDRLVAMVKAIDQYFTDEPGINCGQRVGGEIIVTDIVPSGIATRRLYRFADYEQTQHAAAATVARIGRGDRQLKYPQLPRRSHRQWIKNQIPHSHPADPLL